MNTKTETACAFPPPAQEDEATVEEELTHSLLQYRVQGIPITAASKAFISVMKQLGWRELLSSIETVFRPIPITKDADVSRMKWADWAKILSCSEKIQFVYSHI